MNTTIKFCSCIGKGWGGGGMVKYETNKQETMTFTHIDLITSSTPGLKHWSTAPTGRPWVFAWNGYWITMETSRLVWHEFCRDAVFTVRRAIRTDWTKTCCLHAHACCCRAINVLLILARIFQGSTSANVRRPPVASPAGVDLVTALLPVSRVVRRVVRRAYKAWALSIDGHWDDSAVTSAPGSQSRRELQDTRPRQTCVTSHVQ